jgi:cobalt-zinc-cadmium efflux system outer membrane protein
MLRLLRRALALGACALGIPLGAGARTIAGSDTLTLTLSDALARARAAHPELALARATWQVERADSAVAGGAGHRPELALGYERGGELLGWGEESSLDIDLSQELELGGKAGARRRASSARARTAEAELLAEDRRVELAVRAAFARALFLEERHVLLRDLAELDRRIAAAASARVKDGVLTPFMGRLLELDHVRSDSERITAAADLRQAHVELALAIGAELAEPLALAGDVTIDTLTVSEADAIAVALAARAESEVLRRRVEERRAAHALAESEASPNLTLGAGVSFEHEELAGIEEDDQRWRVGASMPLPFGRPDRAGRARAAAEVARAESVLSRDEARARLELLGALRRFEDAARRWQIERARTPLVRQDLELVQRAYADGRIGLDSYLTEKDRLSEALRSRLEAGRSYWDARAALEAAAGVPLETLNGGGTR